MYISQTPYRPAGPGSYDPAFLWAADGSASAEARHLGAPSLLRPDARLSGADAISGHTDCHQIR